MFDKNELENLNYYDLWSDSDGHVATIITKLDDNSMDMLKDEFVNQCRLNFSMIKEVEDMSFEEWYGEKEGLDNDFIALLRSSDPSAFIIPRPWNGINVKDFI